MTIRFLESGGNYHESNGGGPGVWGSTTAVGLGLLAQARNGSLYGYGQNVVNITPLLTSTGFSGMIAGVANNLGGVYGFQYAPISFMDNNNNLQCELRINPSGQIYFTRNNVNLGAGNPTLSSFVLTQNSWHYLEFKAIFSLTGTGTCEARVDGNVVLTLTNVTNSQGSGLGWKVQYVVQNTGGNVGQMDFYALDTVSGLNQTYLGDITVGEYYDNGPGVNAAWSVNQPAFVLTSVANASGGATVYTGTITNGANPANAWQGLYFTISGFTNAANNGTWLCSASNATSITLLNPAGVAETHAATCAFQAPLQAGIHGGIADGFATTNVGIRPPNENQFISSLTPGQIYDQAHQAVVLTGSIAGVVQVTYARRDDAGARTIVQLCLSQGTEQDGTNIFLGNTDQYYQTLYETDPHTGTAWTVSGLNAATFGVKEIA